jgi:hypothetical protein
MSDLENHGTSELAHELAERATRISELIFTPHLQRSGRVGGPAPSFYDPLAVLMLDVETRMPMCDAKRDDLRRALEYLPKDWRYGEVERALFANYLEARLAAFEISVERLDALERRV